MRLWPVAPSAQQLSRSSIRTTRTLFTVLTASTAFLLSTTAPSLVSASPSSSSSSSIGSNSNINPTANQRNFRLGRPAAALNKHQSQRFFSSSSSSLSSSTNMASLPNQNQAFHGFAQQPPLEPSAASSQLIKDAMDLFGAKPSPSIFARSWSADAVFADPICHAQASRQYLAQWYGMPAAFAESETLEWKLIQQHDDHIEYVQKQRYKVKGLGLTKEMVSTVVMERDPTTGKITRFEDRWNHKPLGGVFSWPFRRLNALTLPLLVGVPADAKRAVQAGGAASAGASGAGGKDL